MFLFFDHTGLTFALLLVVPLTFPAWESASFFSTTLVTEQEPFDFLQFIPANPFRSMANTIVPGVVLFSIAVGVALMGIATKQMLLTNLEIFGEALTRVMQFVMRLTPLGVYAMTASAAGTMSLAALSRLQVYLLTYMGAALLMTFWVLLVLVTVLTLLRYRDIVVPASFNVPHAGKLLQLSFVLFAAWFTESTITSAGACKLMVSGLMSFFGKPGVAMPFLLNLLHIPADMMQLYFVSGLLVARFGTLLSVMHTFALALLCAFAMARKLRLHWPRVLRASVIR